MAGVEKSVEKKAVLALKLSGPLQSWGTELIIKNHNTSSMPSKSGVIGMIAAAMGRHRDEDISDLASLRFGTRSDNPGTIAGDFQSAHIWTTDKNGKPHADGSRTYIGTRYYIEDGCFTIGLEGPLDLLRICANALEHPIYPPYLGRRCCIPDPGMVIGIYDNQELETVLSILPNQCGESHKNEPMRICVESNDKGDRMRRDNPVSFDFHNRQYTYRMEKELAIGERSD